MNNKQRLSGSKWKVVAVALDEKNTLNKNEIAGYRILDSLLKTSNLHITFEDSIRITKFDGKIADTTFYFLKRDTIFNGWEEPKDTEIILRQTNTSLSTRTSSGMTFQLERIDNN